MRHESVRRPGDTIPGGCPDGFWYRPNCDNAARLGLCSMTTIEDHRPTGLGDQSREATVRHE